MNLIHFRGLNCYLNCIISTAAHLGVNYQDTLATLWSEIDFTYDPQNNIYLTKRMLTNFELLGAKLEVLDCASEKEVGESLSSFQEGELMIIGMDTLYIPWSPVYQIFNSPHYFFARKEKAGLFSCFDPTYDKKHMQITHDYIISYAYDLCYIAEVTAKPLHVGIVEEAQEVIRKHPKTQKKVLMEIKECRDEKQKNAFLLGKYIEAMMNNRHMYKHYLNTVSSASDKYQLLFHKDLFLQWEAVKNGLYKASLCKNNESIIEEVCKRFHDLISEEISIAQKIIDMA